MNACRKDPGLPPKNEWGRFTAGFWGSGLGWLKFLPSALACLYALRNSLLPQSVAGGESLVTPLCYALLAFCGVRLLLASEGRFFFGWAMLLAGLPGSILAPEPAFTLIRYVGWLLLFIATGPFLLGKHPMQFRRVAWTATIYLYMAIALASVAWAALGLPNFGRGAFTGVMKHCMLLGPVAGVAAVVALARCLYRSSWMFGFLAVACSIPCLLSGSRIAVVCLIFGSLLVVLLNWRRSAWTLFILVFVALLVAAGSSRYFSDNGWWLSMTGTLRSKGFENTRGHLWKARWSEFEAHPFFGVGVGYAENEGTERDEAGNLSVEPGSSYMALLSMTGISGVVAFAFLAVSCGSWLNVHRAALVREEIIETYGVTAFLLAHAAAEGWLLGVGSPLAFLFWLCLGRLLDLKPNQIPRLNPFRRRKLTNPRPTALRPIISASSPIDVR